MLYKSLVGSALVLATFVAAGASFATPIGARTVVAANAQTPQDDPCGNPKDCFCLKVCPPSK
jgi:hypothetical protein